MVPALRLNFIAFILLIACFFLIALSASRAGLDNQNISERTRIHAYPVAVSYLYHDRAHDYAAYQSIANIFRSQRPADDQLLDAVNAVNPSNDGTYLWAADDRGFADFAIIAFKFFGPSAHSLYITYFVIMFLSCMAFCVYFFENIVAMAIGCIGLLSIYTILPLLSLVGNTPLSPSITIYETRIFDIIALIPILHISLSCLDKRKDVGDSIFPFLGRLYVFNSSYLNIRFYATNVAQVFVFIFLYHCRSSLGWMSLAVALFVGCLFVFKFKACSGSPSWRGRLRPAIPMLLLILGHVLLSAYQHAAYHPRYFSDRGSRTFYHNALMGLADKGIGKEYGLEANDPPAAAAVIKFMKETNSPLLTDQWTTDAIMNAFGGTDFPLDQYERAAKEMYFHMWRTDFLNMLRQHLINRPMALFGQLSSYGPQDVSPTARNAGLWYSPFRWPVVLIVAALGVICAASRRGFPPIQGALGPLVFLGASMIPSVAFYMAITQSIGFFLVSSFMVLLAIFTGGALLTRRLMTRRA